MGLRTVEQYKASLRDGRVVYFRGRRVEDVTKHPVIGVAVNHAAIDYAIAHQPEHRDLAVCMDLATGQEYSRYFNFPANAEDLLKRSELIETSTRLGGTLGCRRRCHNSTIGPPSGEIKRNQRTTRGLRKITRA